MSLCLVHTLRILPSALLAAALTGCILGGCSGRSNSTSSFCRIPESGWNYADTTAELLLRMPDSVALGHITVAVRHTSAYPYANLSLEVKVPLATGGTATDTVELQLADSYGRWTGKGLGDSFQLQKQLSGIYRLCDSTAVKVRHIMRTDTLKGVEQVGIIFDETER